VSTAATGRRMGPFVMFADNDGLRHAVRLGSVLALSDADACCETTLLLMPGGRVLLIQFPLNEVLQWFA